MVAVGPTVSTVHALEAGDPTLPAVSMARTWKACEPAESEARLTGEVQGAKAPSSTWHSKEATPPASLPVKSN